MWNKELGSFPMMMGWGTGSSPALDGDRLFVQCDNEEKSFLVALDKKTGDELWRVERDEKSNWSTPYIWKNSKRTELVTAGKTVTSYDPATGKMLWELGGNQDGARSSPVADDDRLYVGTGGGMGRSGPLTAVKAGAEGDLSAGGESSDKYIAWSVPGAGPPMASPLIYQRLPLHARPARRHSLLLRRRDRRAALQAADRGRARFHLVPLGLRRQGLLPRRKRHDARD